MKKLLAMSAAIVLAMSMAACGDSDSSSNSGNSSAATTTKAQEASSEAAESTDGGDDSGDTAAVAAEALPENPLVYLSFENADGLKAVNQADNENGAFDIVDDDHKIMIAEGQGAKGNALYLDGKYGVDFDIKKIEDDSYTISFWLNADRVATYGPVIQMGRNVSGAKADSPTTWINFTKSTWGTDSADIFPVAWNRNSSIGTEVSADGVWPWVYAMDDQEHGKREWCLVTIVADGNRYVADDGMERIGTKFYLNGELKVDANAENMFYQGLSPEIFAGDDVEAHIGINYWDTMYKGFIDELYIFDEPLTDGQVKSLFDEGNPPAEPVVPAE